MQIGLSSVSTLPVPASYRRDGLAQRQQQSDQAAAVQQQQPQQASQQQAAGEVTRATRASVSTQRGDNLPKYAANAQYTDNLSAQARNAVAAYASNGPSAAERLGVELAGVDVYA